MSFFQNTAIVLSIVILGVLQVQAQDLLNFYPDSPNSQTSGNPDLVYDDECDCYFLAELDRDTQFATLYTIIHIKKIDLDGEVLNSKYYITDFYNYPEHYISSISTQGGEIVLFVNRVIGNSGPPYVHDTYVYRIDKDLNEANNAMALGVRIHRDVFDELSDIVTGVKVNKSITFGDKILFTGSFFRQDHLNQKPIVSDLLLGVIHANNTIEVRSFGNNSAHLEGLSLLAAQQDEFYISARYSQKGNNIENPLIARIRILPFGFGVKWARVYPSLRVDPWHANNFDRGIEVSLVEPMPPYNWPSFVAKDISSQIVVSQFSPVDGSPLFAKANQISLLEQADILDAKAHGTANQGLVILLSRKNSLANSAVTYVLNTKAYFTAAPLEFFDLSTAYGFNSLLGRHLVEASNTKLGIGLYAQSFQLPQLSKRKMALLQTDNLDFACLGTEVLPNKVPIKNPVKWVNLFPTYIQAGQEYHTLNAPLATPTYVQERCRKESSRLAVEREKAFQIFPNPAKDYFHIRELNSTDRPFTIKMYNQMGQLVLQDISPMGEHKVSVRDFAPGLYVVKLSVEGTFVETHGLVIL